MRRFYRRFTARKKDVKRRTQLPGYVEEELRGYLECGILCFGFARTLCTGCGTGFVIAFSCKGRGVCPSCNGRHRAQTAAHLAEIEHLHCALAGLPRDADMPRAACPRLGGISFLHRFGSALNRHV